MTKAVRLVFFALAAFAIAGLHVAQAGTAKNGYDKQKVVYQINEADRVFAALSDVADHLTVLGDRNAAIIVVTHRSGIYMLADGGGISKKKRKKLDNLVSELANRGVKFQICATTIRKEKVDKTGINEHAEIIPSGVAHAAHLQQQGYLYIKP